MLQTLLKITSCKEKRRFPLTAKSGFEFFELKNRPKTAQDSPKTLPGLPRMPPRPAKTPPESPWTTQKAFPKQLAQYTFSETSTKATRLFSEEGLCTAVVGKIEKIEIIERCRPPRTPQKVFPKQPNFSSGAFPPNFSTEELCTTWAGTCSHPTFRRGVFPTRVGKKSTAVVYSGHSQTKRLSFWFPTKGAHT